MACRRCVHTLLAIGLVAVVCTAQATNRIELQENNISFTSAQFSVGAASDILLDLLCVGDGPTNTLLWLQSEPRATQLPTPLNLTSTSYNEITGWLLVFSPFLQNPEHRDENGLVNLQCYRNFGNVLSVDLRPVSTLFFTEELPASIFPAQDLSSLCSESLPDLPTSTVTTVSGGPVGVTRVSYSYCLISSARGSFRSRSVVVEGDEYYIPEIHPWLEPAFFLRPLNITVQPINGVMRGAFSCGVYPSNVVESISWYFDSAAGLGEAAPVDVNDPDVMVLSTGGTSVLVLDSVGTEQIGWYHCGIAWTGSDTLLNSSHAYLQYNETESNVDRIILSPPPLFVTPERESVVVPCVGSQDPVFSGAAAVGGNSSSFGLTITPTRENGGYDSIICTVGEASEQGYISVIAPLGFVVGLDEEVVRFVNEDSSPIIFECEVTGFPATVFLLVNGQPQPFGNPRVTVEIGNPSCSQCLRCVLTISQPEAADHGVYQCVGQAGYDRSTAIVSSSYLNIQFIDDPVIIYEMEAVDNDLYVRIEELDISTSVHLTCSVDAHPIPSIFWTRDGTAVSGTQRITGFREPAESVLNVVVDGMDRRQVTVTCTAELMEVVTMTTITITGYSLVVIDTQPQPLPPLMIGDTSSFTCIASSIPSPSITWFRVQNGTEIELTNTLNHILMTQEDLGNISVRSTLQLTLISEMDFASYFCRGQNEFDSTDSDPIPVIRRSIGSLSILDDPVDVVAIDQESVMFTCLASGLPAPDITWITPPLLTPSTITNTPGEEEEEMQSVLAFLANSSLNQTSVVCVASNNRGTTSSGSATLIIAGKPSPPTVTTDPGVRGVFVEWQSFSHLPILRYLVEITLEEDNIIISQLIPGPIPHTSESVNPLRPFTEYTVTVTAVNRAGNNSASVNFITLQAAPEAPPTNVVAEAVNTSSIRVSWEAPPTSLTNGIITNYILTYASVATPPDTESVTTMITEELVTMGIAPDTAYTFTVAAKTVAVGPASPTIVQRSYPLPPIPPQDTPHTTHNAGVTTTTIPITLPSVDTSQFSHFWVVAVKLTDSNPLTRDFPDNSSFVFYSTDIPANRPYIVSEMSSADYEATEVFVLGDENGTRTTNDFPEQYWNGPLQEGTYYSVFVWAFIPAIPLSPEGATRRQAEDARQYAVYTSSGFSLPISTQIAPDIVSDLVFTRDNPEEGEDTSAVCEWTGSPVPEVTWFKNGEPLDEETLPSRIRITLTNNNFRSELEIQVVELDDAGDYVCNVSNPVGFDFSVATLEVRGPSDSTSLNSGAAVGIGLSVLGLFVFLSVITVILYRRIFNVCKSQHPREINTDNVMQRMEVEMEPNTAYGFQQEINTDNVMQRMEVEMVPNTAYGFQQEINTDNVMQRMEVEMVPNTAYGFQQPSEGTADGTPIYDYIDQ